MPRPSPPNPPPDAAELERVTHDLLDTVASLVRTLGQYAFGTEGVEAPDIRDTCDQWAGHVLLGTVPPGVQGAPASSPLERRRFRDLREYVSTLRQREQRYVHARLADYRASLWTLVESVHAAFADERAADTAVDVQLDRIRDALNSDSIDDIRVGVLGSVQAIGQTLSTRLVQQETQIKALGTQLEALRGELVRARAQMSMDGLTRLYNRAAFDEQLRRAATLAVLSTGNPSLLMVDIDHFKTINDRFGHPVGDQVIQRVADALVHTFPRKSDFVARYGGDEFAVILNDTDTADALRLGARLLARAAQMPVIVGTRMIDLRLSVGVAQLHPLETVDAWLARADQALYKAKEAGRNCVRDDQGQSPISAPPAGPAPVSGRGR